ncbi:major histocompatibility complex class I-related gene protein-like isoform X2 [Lates japonicus]|uniref:Major histocompatibility complex class I-related gene protein-like isoform X2 n=1 Tax=Lates japonicus TaxID=270547 RepID=A0AAD3MUB6_LATJO|nr:major histocompatibility complex class I-related gene protein-like isoform X2 [Lates japonicus]
MAAGQVDDIQADYCDSNSKIIEPKLDRSKNYFDKDAEHRECREASSDVTLTITAAVAALAVVLMSATGFIVYKKKKAKCPPCRK